MPEGGAGRAELAGVLNGSWAEEEDGPGMAGICMAAMGVKPGIGPHGTLSVSLSSLLCSATMLPNLRPSLKSLARTAGHGC